MEKSRAAEMTANRRHRVDTGIRFFLKWPLSIHDGASEMVRPECRVVVRPQASVNLRDNHLHVGWTPFVDLFPQQRRGIERVRADFDFLGAVAWDQAVL